ncbi:Bug family tripartite tricarboxylate transporter substrate binding protein [Xanthobacter tagetidis]|jgi:tripartite-type tricarboxylate transporter receptor subunit TctC|uniref:Tripartite tricarboxylate transporter substrate binding protein n=1 Tax=Xanthobacter tagetidis TaxID=60216 RepID=A0A3L7AK54_9HYPH|nr:tripartite tricarboxylate transporter substrate binding protein [Xanthobacter tagetidis]MBB6306972.1 tripartite-type tricarboxylate transporter receptor subunit TctC [Xanthobacter tagetidis]RLP79968.1 tripartite tricarboxylate transporter substrate binding protein [Xanthobacter tagetidis]
MIRSWLATSAAALATATLLISSAVHAQEAYPTRPIRLIVPLSPGGVTDIVARLIAQSMTRDWGQQVVVDNVVGAGGTLGAEAAARAPADGYTLLMGTVSSNAINASLYKNLRYDNIRDFEPISLVAMGPNMLVVNPSVPATTVAELITLLRAHPNQYSYGSTGVGTSVHLLAERFKTVTGTAMTHVPYKGSGPMTVDLTAGHVQLSFDNMPTALAQVKAGKLRALAVTSPERWPTLPDIPTMAETIPGFVGISWQGLFAPKGVPEPILDKLSAEVRKILAEPAVKERFLELGTQAAGNTRAEFAAFVATETGRWAEMVKISGASVN